MAFDPSTKTDAEIAKLIAQCLKFRGDDKFGSVAEERLDLCLEEACKRAEENSGFVPMLAAMGYNVRHKQVSSEERKEILFSIFESDLPWLNSDQYMNSWGAPGTRQRLREIYRTINLYLDKYGWSEAFAARKWDKDLKFLEQLASDRGWLRK